MARMLNPENLKTTLAKHPIAAILVGITVLGYVADMIKKFVTSVSAVDWLIRHGASVSSGELKVQAWFEIVILGVIATAIITITMYVVTQQKLAATHQELAAIQQKLVLSQSAIQRTSDSALRTLEGMMSAAYKIRQQLIPSTKQSFSSFKLVRSHYFISKDFTAKVVREFHLKAQDQEIHFFEVNIGAESEAPAMEHLIDINFEVFDASKHGKYDLAYLPIQNQSHHKRVSIYFLPFIDPNESAPRIVTVHYHWRGYFLHLKEKLQEQLTFSFPLTQKDIELLECEVYLEPGTGKRLICEKSGSSAGIQELKEQTAILENRTWFGWKYTINNAKAGEYALNLQLADA